ncbi:S8 family serine peptidase [Aquimarina sp. 2201CG5-10]|uniref:S8 family serine peptidase n=1 Tax=Aquimarina callyspongiae TaxID=3098150 RepID=UPI002AB50870|nr:S8 family serine peptidase [Aquimarina sp. 2201CG5-10]MDY8134196.1 S8 family serine peptidase [Aquimarina sp. 2201CG5-10]
MSVLKIKMLLVIVILIIPFSIFSQQKTNKKGERKGVIQVKFTPDQTKRLDKMLQKTSVESGKLKPFKKNEYIKTGFRKIDENNRQFGVKSMKRVFRPAGRFEEKHIAYGLHLWYELEFDENKDLELVLRQYKTLDEIDIVSAVYEIKLQDDYDNLVLDGLLSKEMIKKTVSTNNNFNGAPDDPNYPEQWHYNNTGQEEGIPGSDIKLEQAWAIEKGDSRVIVAVGDENIDVSHPDLIGNMWVNPGEIPGNGIDDDNNGYIDDIHGYDFINDTGTIVPKVSHGTHVAGTIAAETNNGIGVAGIAGGTGNDDGVRLMSCGIIGPKSNAEYFIYAADNGAVISQNSWGTSPSVYIPSQLEAIDYFINTAGGTGKAMNGGVVVFAMGNDDSETMDPHPEQEKVLGVVATNNRDERASYSNYNVKASLSAPGGEQRGVQGEPGVISTINNDKYGASGGTSMACPHVSGVAALIISKAYGNISEDQVRAIIEGTTDFIDYQNPAYAGKLGTGRLNAFQALRVAENMNIPIAVRAINTTENTASIHWKSLTAATNFEIRYKKSETTSWNSINVSGTSKDLTSLEDGQWYDIEVRAINSSGTSPYSGTTTFITKPSLLVAPDIIASTIAETKVDLQWNDVKGALNYEVRYKPKSSSTWLTRAINIGTTAQLVDLFPNTEYELQARSINQEVISSYSSLISLHTTFTPCGEIQPWEPKDYGGSGTKVSYEGYIYSNSWFAQSYHVPGKNSVWRKEGPCDSDTNQLPTVSITQPTNGQVFNQEVLTAIILSADATDTDGTITSVQFKANDVSLSEGNNINWLPTAFGTHTISVTVTDDKGGTATDQVTITVNEITDNQLPTVSITEPADGQVFNQEVLTAIILSADATDTDGIIASVQFKVNDISLSEGNNINWLPPAFGSYTISVIVTDDKGGTATDQVTITINEITDNQLPTVSITQPADGQVFNQEVLTTIILSADASDSDGTITSIQFKVNDDLLSEGNNINWLPPVFGLHAISVTVTDDKGGTATDEVTIMIEEVINGGCNDIAPWDPARIYPSQGGVKVSHKEFVYQNKWWTQNNEPGTGGPWGPWELIGPCNSSQTLVSNIEEFKSLNSEILQVVMDQKTSTMQVLINKQSNGNIELSLHSLDGQRQSFLTNKNLTSGNHWLVSDVLSIKSGVYILVAKIENEKRLVRKVMIIK